MTALAPAADRKPIQYTLDQAAKEMSTTPRTLKAEIAAGRLPVRRMGSRIYIAHAMLVAYACGSDLTDAETRAAITKSACAGAPAVNVATVAAPLPEADQPATVREIAALLGESLGAALRQAVEPGQPAGRRRP